MKAKHFILLLGGISLSGLELKSQSLNWSLGLNSMTATAGYINPGLGFKDSYDIVLYTDSLPRAMLASKSGNFGINTMKPLEKLHVRSGHVLIDGNNLFSPSIYWTDNVNQNFPYYMQYGLEYLPPTSVDVGGMNFWKPWLSNDGNGGNGFRNYVLYLRNDGRVSVGSQCVPNDALMGVSGKLYAREIEVNIENWCDSVFNDNYKLLDFEELRQFILENKHLPGIKSEEEILKGASVNLMHMNLDLLRKVEELHLYILKLEEKIKAIEKLGGKE
ncbi:MAG TPA: hypothetical protein VIL57_06170 [Bacteroidia bacterium]